MIVNVVVIATFGDVRFFGMRMRNVRFGRVGMGWLGA